MPCIKYSNKTFKTFTVAVSRNVCTDIWLTERVFMLKGNIVCGYLCSFDVSLSDNDLFFLFCSSHVSMNEVSKFYFSILNNTVTAYFLNDTV